MIVRRPFSPSTLPPPHKYWNVYNPSARAAMHRVKKVLFQ
jgi:hypothetical protein